MVCEAVDLGAVHLDLLVQHLHAPAFAAEQQDRFGLAAVLRHVGMGIAVYAVIDAELRHRREHVPVQGIELRFDEAGNGILIQRNRSVSLIHARPRIWNACTARDEMNGTALHNVFMMTSAWNGKFGMRRKCGLLSCESAKDAQEGAAGRNFFQSRIDLPALWN